MAANDTENAMKFPEPASKCAELSANSSRFVELSANSSGFVEQHDTSEILELCADSSMFANRYDQARAATISGQVYFEAIPSLSSSGQDYFHEPQPLSVRSCMDPTRAIPPSLSGAMDSKHGRSDQEKDNMWNTYGNRNVALQGEVSIGALPNPDEAPYVAPYQVDELLDLWTNLNRVP
jgi:hypothetical protein